MIHFSGLFMLNSSANLSKFGGKVSGWLEPSSTAPCVMYILRLRYTSEDIWFFCSQSFHACSLSAFGPSEHKTTKYLNEYSGNKPQNPWDFTHNRLHMYIIALLILNSSSHSQWLLKFKGNVRRLLPGSCPSRPYLSGTVVTKTRPARSTVAKGGLSPVVLWRTFIQIHLKKHYGVKNCLWWLQILTGCLWSRPFPELWYAARTKWRRYLSPTGISQHSTRGLGRVSGTTAAPLTPPPHHHHPTNYVHLLLL